MSQPHDDPPRTAGLPVARAAGVPKEPEAAPRAAETEPPRGGETMRTGGLDSASPTVQAEPGPASVPGYEILGELGRGGMGVVYKARQAGLNRVVALKMILHADHASPDERLRFLREAESLARLKHEHIVQVHEVGEHEGKPFICLEHVAGGSLDTRLQGTPLPPREAAALVEKLADAMQAAHEAGIVHRDLKPANILLQPLDISRKDAKAPSEGAKKTEAGERGGTGTLDHSAPVASSPGDFAPFREISSCSPKVTDFGLAKRADATGLSVSGAVLGTPSYMAPEQAAGKRSAIDARTDVYALGAILY